MTEYNEDIVSSYIMYLDASNLYGGAKNEKLPSSDCNWSDDIKNDEDVLRDDNGDHGYVLEVDLEYPAELHDLHSDYPLAPENLKVSADMVSDFSKQIYSHYHEGKPCKDQNIKELILSIQDTQNMLYTFAI